MFNSIHSPNADEEGRPALQEVSHKVWRFSGVSCTKPRLPTSGVGNDRPSSSERLD